MNSKEIIRVIISLLEILNQHDSRHQVIDETQEKAADQARKTAINNERDPEMRDVV